MIVFPPAHKIFHYTCYSFLSVLFVVSFHYILNLTLDLVYSILLLLLNLKNYYFLLLARQIKVYEDLGLGLCDRHFHDFFIYSDQSQL